MKTRQCGEYSFAIVLSHMSELSLND